MAKLENDSGRLAFYFVSPLVEIPGRKHHQHQRRGPVQVEDQHSYRYQEKEGGKHKPPYATATFMEVAPDDGTPGGDPQYPDQRKGDDSKRVHLFMWVIGDGYHEIDHAGSYGQGSSGQRG